MKIYELIKARTRTISNGKVTEKVRRKERIVKTETTTCKILTCAVKRSRGEKEINSDLQAIDLSDGMTLKNVSV